MPDRRSPADHLIEDSFQEFWRMTAAPKGIPKGSIQYQEVHRAFFAGVSSLLDIQMTGLDPGEEPTDADMEKMNSINREIQHFVEELVAGRA